MQFPDDLPRRGGDTLLPMINVVFLLLIFFLISAEMTAPEPFEVASPEARLTQEALGSFTLYADAQGRLAFNGVDDGAGAAGHPETASAGIPQDSAALTALIAEREAYCAAADCTAEPPELLLRADAALPVPDLARLVGRLAAAGFSNVALVTQAPDEAPSEGADQPAVARPETTPSLGAS